METLNSKKKYNCVVNATKDTHESERWRRRCGCLRTSDKLREILERFPSPPPPSPVVRAASCISAFCAHTQNTIRYEVPTKQSIEPIDEPKTQPRSKSWLVITELVHLVQLAVTVTALALYYLIYCYMQLVYYTLRSALYFHQADGPMKITIGVVTVTSLVIVFNLLIRIEKLIGIF